MSQITDWASSQPLWVQVVIGLAVFFVAVPAILGVLGLVLAKVSLAIDLASPTISFAVIALVSSIAAWILWELVVGAAWILAFEVGRWRNVKPATFDWIHYGFIALLLLGIALLGLLYVYGRKKLSSRASELPSGQ